MGKHGACDRPGEVVVLDWKVKEAFLEEMIFMSGPEG